ncbi:MAG: VWA domain-containing protein [SAR86 cluster bacterium]|nr:VWA domain-containing protein [SAR86 cluster bacterium]
MDRVLTDFIKVLRNSNIQASPAETIDAIEVINNIGLEDKELLKRSLSLTLSKTPQEKDDFYKCFEDFFNSEMILDNSKSELPEIKNNQSIEVNSDLGNLLLKSDQAETMLAIAEAAEDANISEIKYFTQRAVFTRRILENMGVSVLEDEVRLMSGVGQDGQPSALEKELRLNLSNLREKVSDYVEKQFLLHGDVSGEHLREKIFKSLNMGQIDKSYMHEVHSLVRKMAKKLANLHSRRKKNHRKGKLDIRKTLRENWSNQGILFGLNWKYKKVDRPKIYVICDVSGSVGAYARFMLMFLFSLTEVVSKIRAFVFSSELGEVTEDFKKQQLEPAIEHALSRHGGGSTDYGQALSDFVSLCLEDIDRKTTIVILGDARNNFGPDKSNLLKLIYERSKQVYWLNPEGEYRWDTGDSVMTSYSAHCTKVMQCGTLDQLERVISTLLRTAI